MIYHCAAKILWIFEFDKVNWKLLTALFLILFILNTNKCEVVNTKIMKTLFMLRFPPHTCCTPIVRHLSAFHYVPIPVSEMTYSASNGTLNRSIPYLCTYSVRAVVNYDVLCAVLSWHVAKPRSYGWLTRMGLYRCDVTINNRHPETFTTKKTSPYIPASASHHNPFGRPSLICDLSVIVPDDIVVSPRDSPPRGTCPLIQ